ncbi:hypothetical protein GQ457_07G008120 [Hibiscus cannabinus]
MFDWFSIIVNALKGYSETIPTEKLVRKMIYSLLESCEQKKMTIFEVKNLKTLTLDELICSFLTHEMLQNEEEEEEKKGLDKKKIKLLLNLH